MKVLVEYRSGETEQFDAPAEILVSAAGIVSICERNGELTYRDWGTLRSIRGLGVDGSDMRKAVVHPLDAGASAPTADKEVGAV